MSRSYFAKQQRKVIKTLSRICPYLIVFFFSENAKPHQLEVIIMINIHYGISQ